VCEGPSRDRTSRSADAPRILQQPIGGNAQVIVRAEIGLSFGQPQSPEGILQTAFIQFMIQETIVHHVDFPANVQKFVGLPDGNSS
jgi:hypothetical protein